MSITTIVILVWVIFSSIYTFEGLFKVLKKKLKKPKEEAPTVPPVKIAVESNQESN